MAPRVLFVCLLWYPIADDSRGGIETYLPVLIRHLVEIGIQISTIATDDSVVPEAELIAAGHRGLFDLMMSDQAWEYSYYEQHEVIEVARRQHEFDIVHSHLGVGGFGISAGDGRVPVLHSLHTPVTEDMKWFVSRHPDLWLNTVSHFQARQLQRTGARHCRTIPNGIDPSRFHVHANVGEDLVFVGRMEAEKGADLAIGAARALQKPLLLAGPIIDRAFFETCVEPHLDQSIRYLGVLGHREKVTLLADAACVLIPSRVEESFGMVAAEACALGTPVVAMASGALPEIIEGGVTGFLASSADELPQLVEKTRDLDRSAIRAHALEVFDVAAAARAYRDLYLEMLSVDPTP